MDPVYHEPFAVLPRHSLGVPPQSLRLHLASEHDRSDAMALDDVALVEAHRAEHDVLSARTHTHRPTTLAFDAARALQVTKQGWLQRYPLSTDRPRRAHVASAWSPGR